MPIDLHSLKHDIEPIIRKAGEILLSYFNKTLEIHKKRDGSIVTSADLASEKYLKRELSALVPGVSFHAEESGTQGTNSYAFVIDPLDGTTNFSRGIGYFCISVSLTYNDEPQLAVVYQPLLDEYFVGIRGDGAFLNGQRLDISDTVPLSDALTVVGLPYTKNKRYFELLELARTIAPHSFAFRHFGASALDLAYVAAGRINGVYLAELAWWDVAAGMLLVSLAGGEVTDFEGNVITPNFQTCLAGSPEVYRQLKQLIDQAK